MPVIDTKRHDQNKTKIEYCSSAVTVPINKFYRVIDRCITCGILITLLEGFTVKPDVLLMGILQTSAGTLVF